MNRISEILIFRPLTPKTIQRIATSEVTALQTTLRERGVRLTLSKQAQSHLAREGYSAALGAREIQRTIFQQLKTPIAARLVAERTVRLSSIHVNLKAGRLHFSYQ